MFGAAAAGGVVSLLFLDLFFFAARLISIADFILLFALPFDYLLAKFSLRVYTHHCD